MKMLMKKISKILGLTAVVIISLMNYSCDKFLNPEQDLTITEDSLYGDWYEYRSIEMGMYALQQQLVEQQEHQLMVLLMF